ncbi:MAG: HD domain-containing phosphohydrolase [Mariprofundaceae bacterium]|nr:HD domain-containing phosphohydrolase [Mariprofundaceae bacterium]
MKLKIEDAKAREVLEKLINAAVNLEAERELSLFLDKLLTYARDIVGAPAGSLYLIDADAGTLQVKVCQNDEVDINSFFEATHAKDSGIPLSNGSIAGYTAMSGEVVHVPDVAHIDAQLPYRFSSKIDKGSGFISKSILAVPIRHPSDGVIGVLELFNPLSGSFENWNIGILRNFSVLAAVTLSNIRLYDSLKSSYLETVFKLGVASEFRDGDTYNHIHRIGYMTKIIASHMGLSAAEQEILFHASSMHDIGKIGIPDSILKKGDALSDEEWEVMKRHPEMGAKMLGGTDSEILQASEKIALYHHEKWNGTGYPKGLAGDQIPTSAQIVAVADVFDALVRQRIYKPAWKVQEALDFIKSRSGEDFSPQVIDAFFKGVEQILEVQKKFGELRY